MDHHFCIGLNSRIDDHERSHQQDQPAARATGLVTDYSDVSAHQTSSPKRDEPPEDNASTLRYITSHLSPIKASESPLMSNSLSTNITSTTNNNNNSNTNTNSSGSNSIDSERRYRPQKYCAVCGDKAIACNFNAVTCESCKAFFRRNAFKENRLKCLFENRCTIDRVTRRFCSKCRLLKCFQIGMKREWILTDEQKQIKRVKILQNRQSRQLASRNSPTSTNSNSGQSSPQPTPINRVGNRLTNSNNGRSQGNSNDKLAAKQSTKIGGGARRQNSQQQVVSGRSVELRDAATSCPDELDLLGSNTARPAHYCSMASQCQYCSLRLIGSCTTSELHHLQDSNQQQHLTNMQMRIHNYPTSQSDANQLTTLSSGYSTTHDDAATSSQIQMRASDCCYLNGSSSQSEQQQFRAHQMAADLNQVSSGQQQLMSQQLHISTHLSNDSGNSFNVFSPHAR